MVLKGSVDIFEAYDRFSKGTKMAENAWDVKVIAKNAQTMKKRYSISFGGNIVPENMELVDRLFLAGVDMLITSGIYNRDTGTVLHLTEDELYDSLKKAPKHLVIGKGNNSCEILPRRTNQPIKPVIIGGPLGATISESIFQNVIESYAQEPVVDAVSSGVLASVKGHDTVPNSPWEMLATTMEVRHCRNATVNAGRPGLCVFGPESPITQAAYISADLGSQGLDATDLHRCSILNELKVDSKCINSVAGLRNAVYPAIQGQMPIFGGYAGGAEETAICDVASTLASYSVFGSAVHMDGPIHVRWGVTTARETLQVSSHAQMAIDYNTDLITQSQCYPQAGPCTEMCLLEIAAQAITDTASGREVLAGCASSKGIQRDQTTGMEARMLGEIQSAACGLEIHDVNNILKNLIPLYESRFGNLPEPKTFQQCYDQNDVSPSAEYTKLFAKVEEEISYCGLDY